ncbi:MAG TPA: NAD(P)/FAD-dependent oxidoreductase [Usitatibacter sp.]|nr:NAD(P)/FAD-dependent oxidoreductase [Usitatibacter sp.]
MKTIAIIGGGLSGLAAGVFLSRRGFEVKLFEANEKLGGCCAITRLRRYTFNDGALYVAVPAILDRAFARLGLDRPTLVPLRRIVATQATRLPDGTVVSMADGRVTVHGANGDDRSARLAVEIERLMQRWRPVLRLFADDLLSRSFSPATLLGKGWRHLHKLRGTLAAELERRFSDPAARAAMAGNLLYTGLAPDKAPVLQILGLVAMFDDGFHLPEGGMGAIPEALGAALRRQGGEIVLGARVERIRVTNGRVRGVEVDGHGSTPADAVISTASGMLTFGSLLGEQDVPASMRRKARKAPLSHKALSVQLGLANALDVPSHSVSVLPMMEDQHKFFLPGDGVPEYFNYSVPTVTMPELAPAGASIVEMFAPIDQARPVDRWDEEASEAAADAAIAALSRIHRLDIVVRRVTSPRDYRDRMHLFDGAIYGLSPAADPRSQFPHRTPVEGLFQAGQTTYPGYGVGPATMSGIFAAEALMKAVRE